MIHTAQRVEDFGGVPLSLREPTSYVIAEGRTIVGAGNYYRVGLAWSFKRPATFTPMQVLLPVLVLIASSIVWWLAGRSQPEIGMTDEGKLRRMTHGFTFLFISVWVVVPLQSIFGWPGGWPWHFLVPLAAYFALVAVISPLRKSLGWLKVGRLSAGTIGATVMAALAFSAVLLGTDRAQYARAIGSNGASFLGMGVVLTIVVFSLLNAAMEEFVFRGVAFDAVGALWGTSGAIVLTALTFGLGHYAGGCPCGISGICIVALGGLVLGGLRFWSGGIALPILAHAAGDATIFYMAVHANAP
jgi:membrane protease YdiL (CAAX protease family)